MHGRAREREYAPLWSRNRFYCRFRPDGKQQRQQQQQQRRRRRRRRRRLFKGYTHECYAVYVKIRILCCDVISRRRAVIFHAMAAFASKWDSAGVDGRRLNPRPFLLISTRVSPGTRSRNTLGRGKIARTHPSIRFAQRARIVKTNSRYCTMTDRCNTQLHLICFLYDIIGLAPLSRALCL